MKKKLNIYCGNKIFTSEEINGDIDFLNNDSLINFARLTKIRGDETPNEFLCKYGGYPPPSCEFICKVFEKNKYQFHPELYTHLATSKMSELDFWKIIALSNIYWRNFDKYMNDINKKQ